MYQDREKGEQRKIQYRLRFKLLLSFASSSFFQLNAMSVYDVFRAFSLTLYRSVGAWISPPLWYTHYKKYVKSISNEAPQPGNQKSCQTQ